VYLFTFCILFIILGGWLVGYNNFPLDMHMSIFVMNLMWASKAEAFRQYKWSSLCSWE